MRACRVFVGSRGALPARLPCSNHFAISLECCFAFFLAENLKIFTDERDNSLICEFFLIINCIATSSIKQAACFSVENAE